MSNNMFRWFFLFGLIFLFSMAGAQGMERYTFSQPKMGTEFRIVAYGSDPDSVSRAVQTAFARIDSLNRIMSDYDPESEISLLAEKAALDPGRYYPVSEDLWTVLRQAKILSRRSRGAFDVTVGPLSKLWRRAFRRRTFPSPEAIDEARSLVNYRWLKLRSRDRAVRLKKAGMRLDLGGIAKGYTVDAVYEVLQKAGTPAVLVDGGGDIFGGMPPPGEPGWRVAAHRLRADSIRQEIVYLKNGAIATSGDTYRYLEWKGKRYAHIINPRTGLGMTDRRMVTVGAESCMLADALASTFSVVSLSKLERLARRFGVRYRLIYLDDEGEWKVLNADYTEE